MILLDVNKTLTVNDDKQNIELCFDVPENAQKLVIDYSYSPKIPPDSVAVEAAKAGIIKYGKNLSDKDPYHYQKSVKNLVTLSLNSPTMYRGAAHRQDDVQHHILSKNQASNGFLKGNIEQGQWMLCLNCHCVLCDIECSIKVKTEVE